MNFSDPKNRNLISRFFPDFPDPVFSRKFFLRGLAGGQTLGHFVPKQSDISLSVTWKELANTKLASVYVKIRSIVLKFCYKNQIFRFAL